MVQLKLDDGAGLCVRFHLPVDYPDSALPECEARSDAFSRRKHTALSALVQRTVETPEFVGRECVFDMLQVILVMIHSSLSQTLWSPTQIITALMRILAIIQIIHDGAIQIADASAVHADDENGCGAPNNMENCPAEEDDAEELCCLKLDHMRDEQRYIKTIRSWTRDLGLRGRYLAIHVYMDVIVSVCVLLCVCGCTSVPVCGCGCNSCSR